MKRNEKLIIGETAAFLREAIRPHGMSTSIRSKPLLRSGAEGTLRVNHVSSPEFLSCYPVVIPESKQTPHVDRVRSKMADSTCRVVAIGTMRNSDFANIVFSCFNNRASNSQCF